MNKPIKYKESDTDHYRWMRDIRRHIHKYPELSFKEHKTSAYIKEKLHELQISSIREMAGTGIVADLGPSDAKHTVALRADMDALPILENTGLEFASTNAGIMHACGHDAHVAMLLGAAALLQKKVLPGRVRLLFQPAEEIGQGASKMVVEGAMNAVSAIFAGHIDTHFPLGTITVDSGIVCASADLFMIRLTGSSGHAARPHETKDAIVAAAALITSLQSLVAREIDPNQAAVVTVGKIQAGQTHNIIAGEAFIEGTIRSTHAKARETLIAGIRRMVQGNANLYGLQSEIQLQNSLPAVINPGNVAAIAKEAAEEVVTTEHVVSQGLSSLGGEDFSFYQREVDGCFVRLGAVKNDKCGPAHSPTFDFDESVLPIGAAWYAGVALEYFESTGT